MVSVAVDGRDLIGSRNTPHQYVYGTHALEKTQSYKHVRMCSKVGFHHISAANILIATGSKPRQLPDYPADGKRILTSDHISKLDTMPKSLCIVGAGVIGMTCINTRINSLAHRKMWYLAINTRLCPHSHA